MQRRGNSAVKLSSKKATLTSKSAWNAGTIKPRSFIFSLRKNVPFIALFPSAQLSIDQPSFSSTFQTLILWLHQITPNWRLNRQLSYSIWTLSSSESPSKNKRRVAVLSWLKCFRENVQGGNLKGRVWAKQFIRIKTIRFSLCSWINFRSFMCFVPRGRKNEVEFLVIPTESILHPSHVYLSFCFICLHEWNAVVNILMVNLFLLILSAPSLASRIL